MGLEKKKKKEFIVVRSQVSVVHHPAESWRQFLFLLLCEKTKVIKA